MFLSIGKAVRQMGAIATLCTTILSSDKQQETGRETGLPVMDNLGSAA
jgi:hypothetical protein